MENQSDNIAELISALSKAQGDITYAIKCKKNPFFKSSYADLPAIWEACKKPLSANGLAVIQTIEGTHDLMFLITMLAHSSGQWIKSKVPLIITKKDIQGMGSSITYARRYSLMAMVGICQEDEDDDGNVAVGNKVEISQEKEVIQSEVDKYVNSWGDKKDHFFAFMTAIMKQNKWNHSQVLDSLQKDPVFTKNTFENWLEKKQAKAA
jgi:hypothetical protein